MAETTEFLTLINCTGKLEIALQSDRELAQFLNKEGFINDEVYTDVSSATSMQTPLQKAGTLVACIKNKVKLNPKRYHILVRHFRQNKRKYEDIMSILEEEYNTVMCDSQDDRGKQVDVDAAQPIHVQSYQKQQAHSFLKSNVTKLKAHLNVFKEVDKAEINPAVKTLINEQIEEFISTCLKTGCNPDDVRDTLTNIHHTDFLISNETLRWAMERVDSIAVQSTSTSSGDHSDQLSSKEDEKLFCDDVIYHATLCSLAASTCDENNFKDFFNEDHQHHNLDEASLSITRKREEVDRYLIARKGKIYFIAFKSESLLSDWQEKFTSFAEGIQVQTDRIPLRFLIQQLHDGFQIVLTGFSYGGLLALSVTASLWRVPNLLSSELLQRNVCCIAFGLPLLNLPHIQEAIDESPELASTVHSFYVKNDVFPQLNIFFDPVYESILDDLGDFNADMGDFDPKLGQMKEVLQ